MWVDVDPLGKEFELGLNLRSKRVRAVHSRVGVSLHGRVPVEPSEAIWEPIVEALRSEDEQDSDVYFVVRAAAAPDHPEHALAGGAPAADDDSGEASELGTALVSAHYEVSYLLEAALRPDSALRKAARPAAMHHSAYLSRAIFFF